MPTNWDSGVGRFLRRKLCWLRMKVGPHLRNAGDAWRELRPMWFPTLVAVAAVAALQTSQGVDLLVIASNDFFGAVLLLLSIAGFAATSWYFSARFSMRRPRE